MRDLYHSKIFGISLDMFNVVLHEGELKIRPMKSSDLPFFIEVRNSCAKWLHDNRKFSLKDAKRWFSTTSMHYFVIEVNNQRVGYLRTSEWDLLNKNVYIGIDIHPDFRRQGIATKAYRVFMDFLFKEKKFNKISLEVLEFNTVGIYFYKKLGFQVEGRRRHHVKRGRRYVDSIIMAIQRNNYGEKK